MYRVWILPCRIATADPRPAHTEGDAIPPESGGGISGSPPTGPVSSMKAEEIDHGRFGDHRRSAVQETQPARRPRALHHHPGDLLLRLVLQDQRRASESRERSDD